MQSEHQQVKVLEPLDNGVGTVAGVALSLTAAAIRKLSGTVLATEDSSEKESFDQC